MDEDESSIFMYYNNWISQVGDRFRNENTIVSFKLRNCSVQNDSGAEFGEFCKGKNENFTFELSEKKFT